MHIELFAQIWNIDNLFVAATCNAIKKLQVLVITSSKINSNFLCIFRCCCRCCYEYKMVTLVAVAKS